MPRSLKLGGESNGRGRDNIDVPNVPRKPRPAPKSLAGPKCAIERVIWKRLWSNPLSVLWDTEEEVVQVHDLVRLRARIDREGNQVPLGVYGQIRSLEDRLYLNPKARRTSGIVLTEPEEPASTAGRGKVARIDDRRREQLRRGQA